MCPKLKKNSLPHRPATTIPDVLRVLRGGKTFLIATHINPDPDALASQLALAVYLKSIGKRVYAVNEEKIPQRYLFLPGVNMARKAGTEKKIDYDAAVIVDCGDLERIGSVQKLLHPGKTIINIDHHISNDRFGDLNLVITDASSTAEVIFDVLEAAEFSLNKQAAVLLYLGIMTDTGCFRYENTTARTHEVVSRLMQFKIPVSELYRKLYETIPLNDLQYFTKVVSSFTPLFDGKVIYLELRRGVVKRFSEEFDLRDKIFRYLRAIKGAEVLVILTQQEKGKTRINLRSQGKINVAKLASHFKGGGHSRASGCIIAGPMPEAKRRILAQLEKIFGKQLR